MMPEDAPRGASGPSPGGRPARSLPWGELAARADEPWAQEQIRRGIVSGAIRVVPAPGGGIRILPKDSYRIHRKTNY
jgi:hypothetical protein